jgi:transcriptional regulator with XRE-family HTH domain
VSPFSHFLHDLRIRRGIRQTELAVQLGYEQSYISALEVGLKGPPNDEFVERLIKTLTISPVEQQQLRAAVQASQRKLVIEPDAPPDIYWLLEDLRGKLEYLKPGQVRMIKEILDLGETLSEERPEQSRKLKRRARKEEATM